MTNNRDGLASGKGVWVQLQGKEAAPPEFALRMALTMARLGPCQKSRRGAALYRSVAPDRWKHYAIPVAGAGAGAGAGFNGPPILMTSAHEQPLWARCDGSEACRRDCRRRCMHAEARALLSLPLDDDRITASHLQMVHVKVPPVGEGVLDAYPQGMPTSGPSCIECSKLMLDAGIGGIWMLEGSPGISWTWRYYTTEECHRASVAASGVHG